MWVGEALEAKGDKAGACKAYRVVEARWKDARPRSVTMEKAKARIEYLAYYDILTGLANRQQFVRPRAGLLALDPSIGLLPGARDKRGRALARRPGNH